MSLSNVFPFVALKPATYPPTSRYSGVATTTYPTPNGATLTYLERRFLPQSDELAQLTQHRVALGDRLDNIAADYLGDPLQFWQICDANDAVNPDDLTATVGALLRITLPLGVPGQSG